MRAVLGWLARGRAGGAADEPAARVQGTSPGGRRAPAQGPIVPLLGTRRSRVRSGFHLQVADGGAARPWAGRGHGRIDRARRPRR